MANKTLETLKRDIALQHPMNSYPTMVGLICGAYYTLIESTLVVGIVGAACTTIGIGSLVVNGFVRRDAFANTAMQRLNSQRERERVKQMGLLNSKLDSHLTRSQLTRVQEKYQTFKDVLSERFTKGTITYNRFLGTAEEIFLLSIKRIEEIHLKERQIAGIDESHCKKRIRQLEKMDQQDSAVQVELASLQSRVSIKQDNERRITEILASNEKAVTTFDVVMNQMSESSCSENELGYLMEELESVSKVISEIK